MGKNFFYYTHMNFENYQPVNDEKCRKVLEFVRGMIKSKNIKKGVNEVTKCINKGSARVVIIATDSEPPELTFSLPILCEDKGVPFIHVKSKAALGKACDVERPVISCCVFVPKEMESLKLEEKIKNFLG